MKRFTKLILFTVSGLILFFVALILTIPKDFIQNVVKDNLQKSTGLILTEEGSKRLFPFGIKMQHVSIFHDKFEKPILILDNLQMKLDIASLFMGGIKIMIDGNREGDYLKGDVLLERKYTNVNLLAEAIKTETIPYIDSFNIGKTAEFNGTIKIAFQEKGCPSGSIDMEGKDIDAQGFKISGFPIPLGEGIKAAFSANLNDCKINIKGLWFEGKDLSANIYGDIFLTIPYSKSPIAIALEIMPRSLSQDSPPQTDNGKDIGISNLLPIIMNYRKSSNYYMIKIKGTIEKPILSN